MGRADGKCHVIAIVPPECLPYAVDVSKFPSSAEWLTRAAETRQLADTMTDVVVCRTLLMIAAGYEKMARHASLIRSLNLPVDPGEDS